MSYTVRYSLVRILIFLGCLGLFRLMGLENLLVLLLVAATVSMLISVFALSGMRDRMSAEIVERSARRRGEAPVEDEAPARPARRRRRDAGAVTDEDVEDQAFR